MKRNLALAALFVLVAVLLYFAASSIARITLIAGLIFLAGHASLNLLGRGEKQGGISSGDDFTFVSIALGPAVLFITSCVLRLAGSYNFWSIIAAMAAIVAISFILRKRTGRGGGIEGKPLGIFLCAYLTCGVFLFLFAPPYDYPFLNGSAVYTTQGFDLFFDKDPSEWPYFGEKYTMPMLYVTHALGALFGVLSSGDPFDFYTLGQYWLHILFTPIIPIGAYLLFRRFMPRWAAILAGAAFCLSILGPKTYSIRGESTGWIFGFGFLLLFWDVLVKIEREGPKTSRLGASVVLSLLYFTLALTHGVVAMVVSFLTLGLLACFLLPRLDLKRCLPVMKIGALCTFALCLIGALYVWSFSDHFDREKVISNYDRAPSPGEPDAAVLFENALMKACGVACESEVPKVCGSPPFLETADVVQMTAFLPIASLFRPGGFGNIPITGFRSHALMDLEKVTVAERTAYLLLFLICCAVGCFRFSKTPEGLRALFWGSISVVVLLVGFSVYMNFSSVSTFPLAATRRTYVYIRFFFWLAAALAIFAYMVSPALRYIARRLFRKDSVPDLPPRLEPVIFALVLVLWLGHSFAATTRVDIGYYSSAKRSMRLVMSRLSTALPSIFQNGRLDRNQSLRSTLFDAIRYVRDHTSPGDWVFTNVISDNQFWYLSSGRYSLLEGSAMYQVYSLQERAAARIEKFARFALTADLAGMSGHPFRYALLYKYCCDDSRILYGYGAPVPINLGAFSSNPNFECVFENEDFVVYKPIGIDLPQYAGAADTGRDEPEPDCLIDRLARYHATLAEGIDFSMRTYPSFLMEMKGFSIYAEWWGARFTIGKEAVFHFKEKLPKKFLLNLKALAYGPNAGTPITVIAGGARRQFTLPEAVQDVSVEFNLTEETNTIKFLVPKPTRPIDIDPKLKDDRAVGLGIISLKIETQPS